VNLDVFALLCHLMFFLKCLCSLSRTQKRLALHGSQRAAGFDESNFGWRFSQNLSSMPPELLHN